MNKKLHLVSLGCTKNLIDSEVMLEKLREYEITNDPSKADVLIVNTCGFINPAKEESLDTIFELHSQRKKDSLLVVSGCLSQRYKEELQQELKEEVDIFTGVGDYDKIDKIIKIKKSIFSPETYLLQNEKRVITGSKAHAYIKLSEGCNQTCSFCAIPGFKGRLRSRDIKSILSEVKRLVDDGFFDFSFISQDSSSYLKDKGEKEGLIKLIDEIEKIKGIRSARILYLYPSTTSDELIRRIIASDIFHNYFEMPIQHISDKMLRIMKRGAGAKRIKEQLYLMRNAKDSFLRTSVIIGHPKEKEEDFEELKNFLNSFAFDRVSLFAYSDEEDTVAFKMDDKVPQEIIDERIDQLDSIIQKNMVESLRKRVGKKSLLLTTGESSEGEFFMGSRELLWAPEIDGEILINQSDVPLRADKLYKGVITELVGDKLLATIQDEV